MIAMMDIELPPEAAELREALRSLRWELATSQNIPAYYVFDDRTLYKSPDSLVAIVPQNNNELLQVFGIGEAKVENYGEAILAVTTQFERGPEIGQNIDDLYLICPSCDTVEKRNVPIPTGLLEQIEASPYSLEEAIPLALQMLLSAEVDSDANPSTRQSLIFDESVHLVSDIDGRRLSTSFNLVDLSDE